MDAGASSSDIALDLRLGRPEDMQALHDLTRRITLAEPAYRDQALARPEAIEPPHAAMERGGVLVAQGGLGIVGYVAVVHDGAIAEIDGLFVDTDQQGRGIGKRLLLAGIDLARKAGAQVVTVVAAPAAEDVYAACGFRQTGPAQTLFGPAVQMALDLDPNHD